MRQLIFLFLGVFFAINCSANQKFKDGDIIFQTSKSSQSKMIQSLTKSKYSHCGIIFYKNGKPYVLEAVQPVKTTPLNEWINRGVGGKYTVMRYNGVISSDAAKTMKRYAEKQLGKNYDFKFSWSEKNMYCSELVYKIYIAGDITLALTKQMFEYDLNSPEVKKEIIKRYGKSFNKNEHVIAPVDIYNSELLKKVYSNY